MDHQELSMLIYEKIEEIYQENRDSVDVECIIGGIALTAAMIMNKSGVGEIEIGNMKLTLEEN